MKNTLSTTQIVAISLSLLVAGLAGCPAYHVWNSGMEGRAKLNKATFDRQVRVAEAKAEAEAAYWHQQRDTVQALGIARANAIIGSSLKNNEAYLYFRWLQTLETIKGNGQVIYLPGTFPNLQMPITEANRLGRRQDTSTGQ